MKLLPFFAAAALSCGLLPASASESCRPEAQPAHWYQASHLADSGRVLAGIAPSVDGPLSRLRDQPAVRAHAAAFVGAWQRFSSQRAEPARQWYEDELSALDQTRETVFYPFSGPDAAYPLIFFPEAHNFILTGLEPIGDLPDLRDVSDADLAAGLAQLRHSLRAILAFSFFRTNDMQAELGRNKLRGVLPIIAIFLHSRGYELRSITAFTLQKDGQTCIVEPSRLDKLPKHDLPGVVVRFTRAGESDVRRLFYLQADLGDGGLRATPQYLAWVRAMDARVTYVKSASYLMHKPYFSTVRQFIVEHSALVLQDDSGIPLRNFSAQQWDRRLYGHYDKPIALFSNMQQPDLRDAFRDASVRGSLPFGIGYQHRVETSNLQRFIRKPAAQSQSLALP